MVEMKPMGCLVGTAEVPRAVRSRTYPHCYHEADLQGDQDEGIWGPSQPPLQLLSGGPGFWIKIVLGDQGGHKEPAALWGGAGKGGRDPRECGWHSPGEQQAQVPWDS